MRLRIPLSIILWLLPTVCWATNYTVKAGGGGNFTTMSACATQMSTNGTGVSDTCTVFAGTYNESVTVPAGSAGNYKIFNVNGSDAVALNSFTMSSHTKIVGNCVEPAAAGSCGFSLGTRTTTAQTASCVSVPDGSTDIFITNNVMYGCGNTTMVGASGTNGVSFFFVQGNTMSYGCGTTTTPNNCSAVVFSGNHILVERNDLSHLGLAVQTFAQFTVVRNNNIHDMLETECGPSSGNCHLDIIYAERSNTVASFLVQYQLWEGNTGNTVTGADGKGLWTAADNPGGCGTSCFNVIGRYNVLAHFGSGPLAQTSGFLNVKYYNNSVIDPGMSAHGSPSTNGPYLDDTSTGGASVNNLYYYPFSLTTSWGWYAYSLNSSGDAAGFTAGANLAFCSASPCGIQTLRNGTSSFLFASDTPVTVPNILTTTDPLLNYSGGDFHLATGSLALNAGAYLTTVAAGDSGSGTALVVADAGFFQDGLGLNAAGVQADCISVTTVSNHVCVTAVNYSTNTLTLASGITRSVGDHVWLYSKSDGTVVLTGAAPNIGALGTGSGSPTVSLSSSSVNFFNQFLSTTSLPQVVVLTNTGTASLSITSITASGNFAQSNNCGTSVGAGNSCNISITFTPAILGPQSGNVTIVDNASGSPHVISLSGTGVTTISGVGSISGTGTIKVQP